MFNKNVYRRNINVDFILNNKFTLVFSFVYIYDVFVMPSRTGCAMHIRQLIKSVLNYKFVQIYK